MENNSIHFVCKSNVTCDWYLKQSIVSHKMESSIRYWCLLTVWAWDSVCVCVCVCVCSCVCLYMYIYACVSMYVCLHICICLMYVCICVYTPIFVCVGDTEQPRKPSTKNLSCLQDVQGERWSRDLGDGQPMSGPTWDPPHGRDQLWHY